MKTIEVTYIGKDRFDREIFLAPKGTINYLRDIYLVDIGYDYENHGGRDFCTVCVPKDGNPFYGEPDTPLGDQYKVVVTNEKDRKAKNENPFRHTYMMLSRMQSDCLYHIGSARENGFAGITDIDAHIEEMKRLWNSLPKDGKPEWLTMTDINDLEEKMKSNDVFYPDKDGKLTKHDRKPNIHFKMKVRFFDIVWDLSDLDDEERKTVLEELPENPVLKFVENIDPEMEGADKLSDTFGYCVESFNFEIL